MAGKLEVQVRAGDVISPPMWVTSVEADHCTNDQKVIEEETRRLVGEVPGRDIATVRLELHCEGKAAKELRAFIEVCAAGGSKVDFTMTRGQPMYTSKYAGEMLASWQRMRDE